MTNPGTELRILLWGNIANDCTTALMVIRKARKESQAFSMSIFFYWWRSGKMDMTELPGLCPKSCVQNELLKDMAWQRWTGKTLPRSMSSTSTSWTSLGWTPTCLNLTNISASVCTHPHKYASKSSGKPSQTNEGYYNRLKDTNSVYVHVTYSTAMPASMSHHFLHHLLKT